MDRPGKKPNSGLKARRLFLVLTAMSFCVFASLSVCNSALAENSEVVTVDPGPPYPRIANYYLLGSVDPAVYDDLAKYDLVVVGTIWTEEQLNELRLRNPNIKILMYVCAYALPASPYQANTWETENYNYANDNNLWWRNWRGFIASDWPGAQMVNVTSVAPRQGPQGTWRQYIINRVQDLVAARPSLDGIFFDNFWQQISWNQSNLQLDSNEDGIMDTNSDLDSWWLEAMTDIASQTRSLFDLAEPGRLQPLSIMGNGAGRYETWLNGSMFEQFPWVHGMNEGNPYQYVWNYSMFHVPGGYLEGNFRPDPYNTTIIAAEWDRAIDRGPVRGADFERNKRFTIVSALMGDGYYALDGNRNGGGHGDLWWEPEYDNDGRQRGYLGYPTGPMYRVANPTGPEIIVNGSFQNGTANWSTGGSQGTLTITTDSVEFHSSPSLRMDVTAANPQAMAKLYQSPVNVTYNTTYTLSFWARSSIDQQLLVHLYSSYCTGYRCMNDTRYNLTNEWTHYETSFTSTGTGPSGLSIFVSNPSTVWIDDVSLREGDSSFYRRDFDNGLVLLNYTNTARSVSLGGTYKRLSIPGSDVWDGASISSETVPPYDARILLKTNHPPVLNPIPHSYINEGQELIFNVTAADPDDRDTLTYSVSGLPGWASFDTATGLFRGTPDYNQAGDYAVTFTVTDAGGLTDIESTIITVNNVNRAPDLPPLRNITMYEGQPLTISLNGSDPDGDPITYLAIPLPEGADLNPNTGVFNWTPDFDQAGIYPITFTVSDGSIPVSQTITITVINVNRAPILNPIGNKSVDEGQALTINLTASDPDGDSLTYSMDPALPGATFSPAGVFSWIPTFDQAGAYNVTFSVSDGSLSAFESITITVNNVNRAPTLNHIGDKTVNEGQLLTFTLSGSDPDVGDVLTYSANRLPPGATFDSLTKTFSWTPNYDQARIYTNVIFYLSDGTATVSEVINITVNNVNRPPVLAITGDTTVNEDQPLTLHLTASDPDGDNIALGVINAPPEAQLGQNGVFSWTTNYNQAGIYNVTFTASDGQLSVSEMVTLTVINVNRAPIFPNIGPKSVNEGEVLAFTISGSDLDGDDLIFSAGGLPEGASFDPDIRRFDWIPNYRQAGIYPVTFSVSDGQLVDSETVTITVNDVVLPDAPTGIFAAVNYNNGIYIGLFWQAVSDKQLLGYNIYQVDTATGVIASAPINAAPINVSFYSFSISQSILYKFVVTTLTSDGRESFPSEVVSIYADPIAPSRVTDLRLVKATDSSVILAWTATGDDGNVGQATSYDMRYADIVLADNLSRWSAVGIQVQDEPAPAVSGTAESITITNLLPNTQYYFSLMVVDDNGNKSGISNEVSVTTLPAASKPFNDGGSGRRGGNSKDKKVMDSAGLNNAPTGITATADIQSNNGTLKTVEIKFDKSEIMKSLISDLNKKIITKLIK